MNELRKLPDTLTAADAVEAAYGDLLAETVRRLKTGLPVLVECDKDMTIAVYKLIRDRLKKDKIQCLFLDGRDGREANAEEPGSQKGSLMDAIVHQLRESVRGLVEGKVIVLPHLDLLTVSSSDLTTQGREVVPLLYENPELVWLGFNDPSYSLPPVVTHLFPWKVSLVGVPRARIDRLVTSAEMAKFGRDFDPLRLYKHVSGLNPVRLRKVLRQLDGPDYPAQPQGALSQIRQATIAGQLEIPHVDMTKEIGGYAEVKQRLNEEILEILARRDLASTESEKEQLEKLIPRGIIFWGPPGTGKTLFAKAFATALGAAITVVSGPELKSKWVGQSESNLRRIFHQARVCAPSVIVFDEIDSFAVRRGTYAGSGVEHSLVNQLLTEMDGFRREELVFVIGTTNFPESLDPALLRPGRFEYQIEIPYPDEEARRQILSLYDRFWDLRMTKAALERAVDRTRFHVPGAAPGTRFSGDHLQALCRAIARDRIRASKTDPVTEADIEAALSAWNKLPPMNAFEKRVVSVHEAGHALVALLTPHTPPLRRISLSDDVVGTSGHVECADRADRHVVTLGEMLDRICVLMGGRESERLILGDVSLGATQDLQVATRIARELVEVHGLGAEGLAPMNARQGSTQEERTPAWGAAQRDRLDDAIATLLETQRARAARLLADNQPSVEALARLLVEKQFLEASELNEEWAALGVEPPGAKRELSPELAAHVAHTALEIPAKRSKKNGSKGHSP